MIACESALLGLPAEVHRAEAEPGDRQAAAPEVRVLHGDHPGTLAACCRRCRPCAFDAATAVRRAEGGRSGRRARPRVGRRRRHPQRRLPARGGRAGRGPGQPAPAPGRRVGQLPARHRPRPGHARRSRRVRPGGRSRTRSVDALRRRRSVPVRPGDDGDPRGRPAGVPRPMPDVPPVEECLSRCRARRRPPGQEVGLRHRVETRLDPATGGLGGAAAVGRAGDARVDAVRRRGGPDPLALLIFADVLPPTFSRSACRAGRRRCSSRCSCARCPAPGWCLVEARASEIAGGWIDEDYRIWDSTGRLVAQSRQLARAPARVS